MQDPVDNNGDPYGTISDIDPDGGTAYTTLQGWYDDTKTEADIQHARCHHGSAAGLGSLVMMDTPTWAANPEYNKDHPCCIYAADGNEQDGSQDDDLQGAAIAISADGSSGIAASIYFVSVSGLRLTMTGNSTAGIVIVHDSGPATPRLARVERNMIVHDRVSAAGNTIGIMATVGVPYGRPVIANNLLINKQPAKDCAGISIGCIDTGDVIVSVLANTLVNCMAQYAFFGGALIGATFQPGATLAILARNNVIVDDGSLGSDTCFRVSESDPGSVRWTGCSHNVSSDDTADSIVGGTDNIINAAIGDVWADIAADDAPFTPKVGGELDPADGANLYASGVATDAVGVERPTQGAHHRGGVEIFAGLYKAYGGPTGGTVDYSTMRASVRAGAASMDIAGLGLTGGGVRWLACRATSAAGVEETNTDRLARVVVDQFGQLQPLPLAAVRELTGERRADGAIIVGFSHITSPGWVAPTRFEVLSDNGTGELNLTTPVASISVVDPAAIDYEVTVIPSVLPAMFSARACTQSASGPVAPAVTISPPSGPIAPQQV